MSSSVRDPVVLPGATPRQMTTRIATVALGAGFGLWWWIAFIPAGLLSLVLLASILWLFYAGIGIWGIDWPVAWGFAILSYVWWIAIASGGTFISALFYLTRAEWRTSLNRLAETMTLCAAVCAGIYPILHLGRPWFAYWLFVYPNTMGLWPQFRSPLVWDFYALFAYVLSSVMFWYLGLIPDLATMRDRVPGLRGRIYGVAAFGFRGSGTQWRHFEATYGTLAAIMAPMVVSVHSIVGLDFAGAQTVGWHSTQFPPFFVFGAMLSGIAAVQLIALPMRKFLHLEEFITTRHMDVLGRLLLTASLFLGYAYLMDAFTTFYRTEHADQVMFHERLWGRYAYVYWSAMVLNVFAPQLMWFRRARLSVPVVLSVAAGVIVGMWFERYEIVVTSLHRPRLPSAWGNYAGTFWDWSTLLGTVGFFIAAFLLLIRVVPVISMFEMRGLLKRRA